MTALPSATLAAFDLDHTLTRRDCVLPFMVRVAGRRRVLLAAARNALLLILVALGRGDRDRAKSALVRSVFSGRDSAEVNRLGELFAQETKDRWLRADVLDRLRWHQQQGHSTALVSASLQSYVEPLARLLGIDRALCTALEVGTDGLFAGSLRGPNCRGAEKVHRLEQAFVPRPAVVWAYGDSAGDREMLAWSDHPHLIRPKHTLPAEPNEAT